MTNGNGLSRIALPAARAARGSTREVGELAVGDGLAPTHFTRERFEREPPKALDAFEIELDIERVALAREPVVELARDLAIGRARRRVGLVVTGQTDLAQSGVGNDDGDLAVRTRLRPELHARER